MSSLVAGWNVLDCRLSAVQEGGGANVMQSWTKIERGSDGRQTCPLDPACVLRSFPREGREADLEVMLGKIEMWCTH